jgi:hypothetical protein
VLPLPVLMLMAGCGNRLPTTGPPIEDGITPACESPSGDGTEPEDDTGATTPAPVEEPPANSGETTPAPVDEPLADSGSIVGATWGVAVRDHAEGQDVFLVFGSSFAIDEARLVTNAHVVDAAVEVLGLMEPSMELVVVQHETRVYCPLAEMYVHPDYDAAHFLSTPDLGVLIPDCILPTSAPVAGNEVLYDLALLDNVSLCGFPGDVTAVDIEMGSSRPRATCLTGSITGFRPFDFDEATTPLNASVIQHDIQTSAGTSGGPLFDEWGRVIAVNSAATTDPTASNRYAIRIDEVWGFLADIEEGLLGPVDTAPVTLCGPGCDYCWFGTEYENNCPLDWCNDGDCDCGCQFSDTDCGGTCPTTYCPSRAYWNSTYSFGYNPPLGFNGPYLDDNPSAINIFSVDFVFDELLHIDIDVATGIGTLDTWVNGWVQIRSETGNVLLGLEDIVMPSGVEATMLEWRSPGSFIDCYWIELWSIRNGLRYSFTALMTPSDFMNFGGTIRAAFRSVCVE